MNFDGRLAELCECMDVANIDLVILGCGARLYCLSGIRRWLEHRTDHHVYAEWATGAAIGRKGGMVVFTLRSMVRASLECRLFGYLAM